VAPDADQLSVAFVATPVAPDVGVGLPGVPGREPVPAVVNDQVTELATMAGLTGVANVFETIFQKYVVPAASGVDGVQEYCNGGLLTSCAGTFPTTVMFDDEVPR
jgi:hypothetical protein